GVNNHQGSRATADPALMQALMPALRQRGLFFVDSRTTAATVAYDTAEHDGVRAASRKVFLDDTPTREAILAQLDLAARDARRDGWSIAIGHPHPATIAALREGVPRLEARGIRLVFASDVVRYRGFVLARRGLRLKSHAAPKLRAVIHRAVGDYEFHFANIPDVFQRIAVDDNHVGALPWLHCPEFLVEPHRSRRNNRSRLNCFHRFESGLHVQFNFA